MNKIDIRPSCIACGQPWMPPESVDAQRVACDACAPVDEALDVVLVEMAEACISGDLRATAVAVRKAHARDTEVAANNEVAVDIEHLAVVIGALEAMTPAGRKAAMSYLIDRYEQAEDPFGVRKRVSPE